MHDNCQHQTWRYTATLCGSVKRVAESNDLADIRARAQAAANVHGYSVNIWPCLGCQALVPHETVSPATTKVTR